VTRKSVLPGRSNVNTIYGTLRQTGLSGLRYKQKVLDAIDFLEKGGLIRDVSGYSRFRPGKEQPKELTQVGAELAEMISKVEEYRRSYSKLTEQIRKYFDVPHIGTKITDRDHHKQEKIIRSILLSRGFPSELIDLYKEIYKKTLGLRGYLSPAWTFSIIIMKYASILSKVPGISNDPKITKDIISGIVMDSISEYLSFILKDLEDYNSMLERNQSDEKYTIDYEFGLHIHDSIEETLATISNERFLNNKIFFFLWKVNRNLFLYCN
jgi:hypothetical protein